MRKDVLVLMLALFASAAVVVSQLLANDEAADRKSSTTGTTNPVDRTIVEQQDSLYVAIGAEYRLIEPTIRKSCYDCHSSQTHYPWYHSLPVIKGMIDGDIRAARERLDFTDGFPFKSRYEILDILSDMKQEIVEGDMPPWDYRLMHWGTAIDGTTKDSVVNWIDTSMSKIELFFDSHGITYKKPVVPVSDQKN